MPRRAVMAKVLVLCWQFTFEVTVERIVPSVGTVFPLFIFLQSCRMKATIVYDSEMALRYQTATQVYNELRIMNDAGSRKGYNVLNIATSHHLLY